VKEINFDNDEYTFTIQIKNKGTIAVDAFEMAAKMRENLIGDENPGMETIRDAIKECAWDLNGSSLNEYTDYELEAAGQKVMLGLQEVGKEQGWPQITRPPTDGSPMG